MEPLMPEFRKNISTGGDAVMVLVVGVGTLFLCALLLLDSETTLLMLFLSGVGYLIALGYVVLVCYLFAHMLRRRDAWLLYFLGTSTAFVAFIVWLLSAGIIDHHELSSLFVSGGIPYSLLTIAFVIAMVRGKYHL